MVLEQQQGALDDFIETHALLQRLLGPAEVQQTVDDLLAARDFVVDDLEIFVRVGGDSAAGFFHIFKLEAEAFGARGNRRERIINFVHHTGGELADRRELLGLRETLLCFLPVGDVFADRDDVRDGRIAEAHRNFRDAIGAQLAGGERLHLIFLNAARREDVVELAPQHFGRLTMEDLEDRPADRFLARDTLHSGFAFAIPCLNAILAIDHVQSERERVDDLLGEDPFAIDLRGARFDFNFELPIFSACASSGPSKFATAVTSNNSSSSSSRMT